MNISLPDELNTAAALYALDLLEVAERHAFESLAGVDGEAGALALKHSRTVAALLEAVNPLQPPPTLRKRLLARLPGATASRPGEIWLQPGVLLVQSQQKPWEDTGIPGIRRKLLHFDAERNYASNLVSMAAGSVYPRHRHAGFEELFMLSGQVSLSGHRLGVGDYCRAEAGTVHDPVIADSDCLFIAFASVQNEILHPVAQA